MMTLRINVTPGDVYDQLKVLGRITVGKMIRSDELTEEELNSVANLFEVWSPEEETSALDVRRYNGILYECIQDHTTQLGWEPNVTPALWKDISAPGIIPEWVRPTGAHDTYGLNEQVTHIGKVWRSNLPFNDTEPGQNLEFGWWTEVV